MTRWPTGGGVETFPDPTEWLTVSQAAKLTGESARTWRWRAQREAIDSQRHGRQALSRMASPPDGRGKAAWWVSRALDSRLTQYPTKRTRDGSARGSLLERHPEHQVTLAYRKAHWLLRWRRLCDTASDPSQTARQLARRVVREARAAHGDEFRISFRALQDWWRSYNRLDPDGKVLGVAGLVYGCGLRASKAPNADDADGTRSRSPEAIEYFYKLYHCESAPGVRTCHEMTRYEAGAKGWTWPAGYSATLKWLRTHDNVALSCLLREGPDVWCRKHMPHIEIDYTLIEPGRMYQTDHHQCDFWVEHDGQQLRPWLCVVQDLRSRAIVGWHLTAKPHQDGIIAAYLMAFRDRAVPERIRIDNGKDFASELLCGVTKATRDSLRRQHGPDWQEVLRRDASLIECVDERFMGITAELGIELTYAIPYAPWSKGVTERWFGLFEERCGKSFTTYCGRSSSTRPECLQAIRDGADVPTMDDAREAIGEFLTQFHNRPHEADDMAGRTPMEVWNTASRLRRAGDTELLFLMQARGCYRVGKNGVAFKVGGVRFTYGAGNPALYRHTGRDVFLTIDPNCLDHCYAFTADRKRFVGRLEANERISPMATVDEVRAANAKVGKQRKIMHQAGRSSPNRTRAVAEELRTKRRERVAKLRATGTEGKAPDASIVPVRTGFEGASEQVRKTTTKPKRSTRSRSFVDAAAALGGVKGLSKPKRRAPRLSDSVLAVGLPRAKESTVTDEGDEDSGTDAGNSTTDLLRLIGSGNRHDERTNK